MLITVSQSPTQPSSSDANTTTNSKDDSKLPNSGSWVGTGVGTKGNYFIIVYECVVNYGWVI